MLSAITKASLSGTTQLLTLCLTGAYLSHKRVLTPSITRSLSSATYNAFLPALLYTSTFALSKTNLNDQATLIVPPLWALLTLFISALTAAPVSCLTPPPIRRTIFVALLLGNANNLPLLLLQTLCEELPLGEGCYDRAGGYIALYLTVWNALMWTVVLSYLCGTKDNSPPSDIVTVRSVTTNSSDGSQTWPALDKLLSPPFIAIVLGGVTGFIPTIHAVIETYLAAVTHALKLLAAVVVPISSVIVGARLHSYKLQRHDKTPPLNPFSIVAIVSTRFVLLPLVGRWVYSFFDIGSFVEDPLLRIYLLVPFFVPTASNSVVMVQMAAAALPGVGDQMEAALLVSIFWQYVFAPIFLTVNMAVGLGVVKESGGLNWK